MRTFLSKFLLITLFTLLSITGLRAQQQNVMEVLDASGSMWEQIDGRPKINIARQVMSKMLRDLDGKANIGVLTYGHRQKGDCRDIETCQADPCALARDLTRLGVDFTVHVVGFDLRNQDTRSLQCLLVANI